MTLLLQSLCFLLHPAIDVPSVFSWYADLASILSAVKDPGSGSQAVTAVIRGFGCTTAIPTGDECGWCTQLIHMPQEWQAEAGLGLLLQLDITRTEDVLQTVLHLATIFMENTADEASCLLSFETYKAVAICLTYGSARTKQVILVP